METVSEINKSNDKHTNLTFTVHSNRINNVFNQSLNRKYLRAIKN